VTTDREYHYLHDEWLVNEARSRELPFWLRIGPICWNYSNKIVGIRVGVGVLSGWTYYYL